jgi:hypothetical protein
MGRKVALVVLIECSPTFLVAVIAGWENKKDDEP